MNPSETPVVEIKHGKVKGTKVKNVDGGEFLAFEAIPYAEPPIGPLRFKDPQPLKPWNGISDNGSTVPKAPQYDFMMECCVGTEDCLYLNVATNSLDGKRAVMVWIHGGGFAMSTSSFKLNGPDYLIKRDIVFVSITYRLGCFGFLDLGVPEVSGNQGMKDIVAGLGWVRDNIHAFGGDPNNVTIFGESAGGVAVHLLTLSPMAEGLFHKAIVQSGVSIDAWTFSKIPVKASLCLATTVGDKSVTDPVEALKILMEAPMIKLVKAQRLINPRNRETEMTLDFLPCVDKASDNPFLPEHPRIMCQRGINVPVIIGCTSDEGLICLTGPTVANIYRGLNDKFPEYLAASLGIDDVHRVEKIVDPVKKFYFGDGTRVIASTKDTNDCVKLLGDLHFFNGMHQIIEIQSKLSTPTYVYKFSYIPSYMTLRKLMKNNIRGAGHGDELGALFHSPGFMGNKGLRKGTMDYLVKERLTRMWTNFAKTGNPTVKLDEIVTTEWKPIAMDKMNYLEINENLIPGVNFGEERWKFWKPLLETLELNYHA